jgi:YfiH family protein
MRAIVDRPWKTVRQVHGSTVAAVDATTGPLGDADALVTRDRTVAIAIRTADCAPIVLASPDGMIGVVHAGWRGLLAGVIEQAVDEMAASGASDIQAAIGPCIHAECYAFSGGDLDLVAARYGEGVRGHTTDGAVALDMVAGVRAALAARGVEVADVVDSCTACDSTRWFSHRARGEVERLATVAWLP